MVVTTVRGFTMVRVLVAWALVVAGGVEAFAPRSVRLFDSNAPRCPTNGEAQLLSARDAIVAATEAGVARQIVRTLLPRGEARELTPLDETWTGGIMQLFRECSPLSRDLLRRIGARDAFKEKPVVREQRLDASGVDGEALQIAECAADPRLDASCFVQPSLETLDPIVATSRAAGPRLVLLLNPQFKDLDDTLDFLASKAGLLGQIGTFLGGKASFTDTLTDLGFADTFSLQEVVVAGTRVRYFLAYPYTWQIYALSDDPAEAPIWLGQDTMRPDYNKVADVLAANKMQNKLLRDTGQATTRLLQGSITTFYEPEDIQSRIPADSEELEGSRNGL